MSVDLIVKNCKLVCPRGIYEAGIAIKDGVIVEIARDIYLPKGYDEIDAGGNYVLPGVLDGHSHTFLSPETPSTGTKAAAKGGITTMLEMPGTQMGCFNQEQLTKKIEIMKKSAYVDFCIHAGAASGYPEQALTEMWRKGVTGVKFFISNAGPKWPQTFDGEVIQKFKELASCDGLALIHAENDAILRDNIKRLKTDGRKDFEAHLEWRPRIAEVEAGKRIIEYIKMTGTRGLIVHTGVPETVWNSAKARMDGAKTYVETCPQYLYFTKDDVGEKGPWCKFAPPPRTRSDKAEIRRLLQEGWIDTVATDHAPYGKERKKEGLEDIFEAPNGIPGLETFLPLLLNGVNEGWLTLERLSAVTSENPARLYGIYPRKGTLQLGADGDLVIVDINKKMTIRNEDQISACGWTPYDGKVVQGWPVMSFISGRKVMFEDSVLSKEGSGEFVQRVTS